MATIIYDFHDCKVFPNSSSLNSKSVMVRISKIPVCVELLSPWFNQIHLYPT